MPVRADAVAVEAPRDETASAADARRRTDGERSSAVAVATARVRADVAITHEL